jgi:hypothetical protein
MMRKKLLFIASIGLLFPFLLFSQENESQTPPPPCSRPEAGQFDFWIGEWELSWPGEQMGLTEGQQGSGTNNIRKILGGCVIEENFSVTDKSFMGKSWSVYNPQKQEWQQTWVDNQGGYLLFSGTFMEGKMELRTKPFERNGKTYISRMVFENISENSLDWNWQRSEDDGKTWVDLWNIHYERKKDE